MRRFWLTVLGAFLGAAAAVLVELPRLPPLETIRADDYVVDSGGEPSRRRPNAPEPAVARAAEAARPGPSPSLAPPPAPSPTAVWLYGRLPDRALTEHYRVHGDLGDDEAAAAALWLEERYPEFVTRFGAAPSLATTDGRLSVFLYRDRSVYRLGPPEHVVPWPGERRGFVDDGARAHVEWGDDPVAGTAVLAHEAAHQLHRLALGEGGPYWYREGVAHDLAWDWERRVEPESGPLVTAAPPAGELLVLGFYDAMADGSVDLARLLAGEESGLDDEWERRGLGLVIVRYFRSPAGERHATWFEEFERRVAVDDTPPPPPAGMLVGLREELLDFARTLRPPNRLRATLQLRDGGRREVEQETSSLFVPLMQRPDKGTARLSFQTSPLRPGEFVGFAIGDGDTPGLVLRVDQHGAYLTVERRVDGELRELTRTGARARVRAIELGLAWTADGEVRVDRNGIELYRGTPSVEADWRSVGVYMTAGRRSRFSPSFHFREVVTETVGR